MTKATRVKSEAAGTMSQRADPPARNGTSLPRSAEILSTLAREVAAGDLPPGAKLEEESLCERFHASRTPVREALKQLAAQGVIELRPRQGAFVVQLTVETLAEMFETMGFLEAACAALAARRYTAEDRKILSAAHEACVRAAEALDPESFYSANAHFHECIYRASHNRHIEAQTLDLRNRVEAYRRESTFHAGLMNLSLREHEAVLASIFAMDEDTAASRMLQHLDTLRNDAVSMAAMVSRRSAST